MKPYLNKFIGMGTVHNLKKVETSSGKSMCSFSLRIYKKTANSEIVTFINCNAYAGIADVIIKNVKDKESMYIEGHIQVYKDKDGVERFSVGVEEFKFISGSNKADDAA